MKRSTFSRRQFVKTASLAAAGPPVLINIPSFQRKTATAPSDKISLGLIGCGGLGKANLSACAGHPDVVKTAACDVWQERLDAVVKQYKCKDAVVGQQSWLCVPGYRKVGTRI